MPTQLALFGEDMTNKHPRTNGIDIPFEWRKVSDLLNLPSTDFGSQGLRPEYNREDKRADPGYQDLLESIRDKGFLDPIYVHPPHTRRAFDNSGEELGNGHHRLLAALDLGYEWVPVTYDDDEQWRTSGVSAQ
jgi:hypothetical protein